MHTGVETPAVFIIGCRGLAGYAGSMVILRWIIYEQLWWPAFFMGGAFLSGLLCSCDKPEIVTYEPGVETKEKIENPSINEDVVRKPSAPSKGVILPQPKIEYFDVEVEQPEDVGEVTNHIERRPTGEARKKENTGE